MVRFGVWRVAFFGGEFFATEIFWDVLPVLARWTICRVRTEIKQSSSLVYSVLNFLVMNS